MICIEIVQQTNFILIWSLVKHWYLRSKFNIISWFLYLSNLSCKLIMEYCVYPWIYYFTWKKNQTFKTIRWNQKLYYNVSYSLGPAWPWLQRGITLVFNFIFLPLCLWSYSVYNITHFFHSEKFAALPNVFLLFFFYKNELIHTMILLKNYLSWSSPPITLPHLLPFVVKLT